MSRWRRSLGVRLVFAFVMVVLVSMSVPALFTFGYFLQRILFEAKQKMESDLGIASLLFEERSRGILRIGRTLSRDGQVEMMVSFRLGNPLRVRVMRFMGGLTDSEVTAVTVVDRDGVVLLRTGAPQSTGDSLKEDVYVRRALDGREAVGYAELSPADMWTEGLVSERERGMGGSGLVMRAAVPIYAEAGESLTPLAKPLPGGDRPVIVGAVVTEYLLNRDTSLLREIRRRTRGVASVYVGTVAVNTTRRGWVSSAPPGMLQEAENAGGVVVRRFVDEGEMGGYFVLRDVDRKPLGLFELRSSMSALSQVWQVAAWNIVFLVLVGLGIAVILGVFVTARITRPIEKLRRGSEEIGRGNLTHRIGVSGYDEIAELADSFNVMRMRLYHSMEQMRLSKKQIEDYSEQLRKAHESLEMYSRELEKVNQQLLESNVKLQKANEVKDTFLSTVSHELKTPLTTIMGYISMFVQGALGSTNEEQSMALEVMLRRARNLQTLIADLLSLSRIDAGRFELRQAYVDLERELRSLDEIYAEQLRNGSISLLVRLDGRLPRVYADPDRLMQVLTNLVGNAVKFTAPGGRITVEARHDEALGMVEVTVRDTGIGIPKSELPHIFERFYQVDRRESREYSGTGLGLAIAKELVELQGGTIAVESEAEGGSTFRFTLPTGPGGFF